MDPQVQGSFIPKQSLSAQRGGGGFGLVLMLVIIIFVLSIAAAAAAYGYQVYLNNQIQIKDQSLQRDEGAFDAASIDDLARMDKRMTQAKVLLQNHVDPAAIFAYLGTITLEQVQFTSFTYALLPNGTATLSLAGIANSYSSVALQSDQFGASKYLNDVVFSGVSADSTGKVTFAVQATIDPSLINFARNLATQNTTDTPDSTDTTQPTTQPQPAQ